MRTEPLDEVSAWVEKHRRLVEPAPRRTGRTPQDHDHKGGTMNISTCEPGDSITRTLNARRELVWRAWTEEKELAYWLPSTPLETISFDVHEGGRSATRWSTSRPARSIQPEVCFSTSSFRTARIHLGLPLCSHRELPCRDPNPHRTRRAYEMIFHLRGFAGHPAISTCTTAGPMRCDNIGKNILKQTGALIKTKVD